jgi:L,D-transpeptidase ErfK/SrfK
MSWLLSGLFLIQLLGSDATYTVRPGESLTSIGARFGVDARVLAAGNGLKPDERLQIGQQLIVDNRHIVPATGGVEIVVNVPQRMLFYTAEGGPRRAYPIAAGRATWKTPTGAFTITVKEADPTWDVPPSIQEEMRREGKPVLTHVLPSPQNPLGKYWLGLSIPGIGIHGTNASSSIYGLVTHGCIRLHPDDIEELFTAVQVGAQGRILYEQVLLARDGDSIFLEVHPDSYRKGSDPLPFVIDRARTEDFLDMLDLSLVQEVIEKRDGIARDVTRRQNPEESGRKSPGKAQH